MGGDHRRSGRSGLVDGARHRARPRLARAERRPGNRRRLSLRWRSIAPRRSARIDLVRLVRRGDLPWLGGPGRLDRPGALTASGRPVGPGQADGRGPRWRARRCDTHGLRHPIRSFRRCGRFVLGNRTGRRRGELSFLGLQLRGLCFVFRIRRRRGGALGLHRGGRRRLSLGLGLGLRLIGRAGGLARGLRRSRWFRRRHYRRCARVFRRRIRRHDDRGRAGERCALPGWTAEIPEHERDMQQRQNDQQPHDRHIDACGHGNS